MIQLIDVRRTTEPEFSPLSPVVGGDLLIDPSLSENGLVPHSAHSSPGLVNGKSRPREKCSNSGASSESDSTSSEQFSTFINEGREDQMQAFGYRKNRSYVIATWVLYLITLGVLRLVFHWKPQWKLYFTHIRCPLVQANKIMLIDKYKQIFVETVHRVESIQGKRESCKGNNYLTFPDSSSKCGGEVPEVQKQRVLCPDGQGGFNSVHQLTYFHNKQLHYIWNEQTGEFDRLRGLDENALCTKLHSCEPLNEQQASDRRFLFGFNEIKVEVKSYGNIMFNELVEPFYVFQIFSVIMWCADNYVYYATCIVIMSTLSLATSVIQIRRNQQQLRDTVHGFDTVTVCRPNDQLQQIESSQLVPGDVIVLPPHGGQMHCDAVLIAGNAIVNESMLTGESVPVTKTPLPADTGLVYDPKEHAKHTLFCGTNVIQTRFYSGGRVRALVVRTAFLSAKGELVRSILFPKPVDFHFNRHIYRFIMCLAALAMVGFIYTVIIKMQRHVPFRDIFFKSFDLITIIIPPALPAAMTVGVVFAQRRLRKEQIFCISPRSINISGCLNCVCFDKTGTLTEDELSFAELRPIENTVFHSPLKKPAQMLPVDHPLLGCLSTCHGLTQIDGELVGDPLDQKMFECTGWQLQEPQIQDTNKFDLLAPTLVSPPNDENNSSSSSSLPPFEIGILRQFPFSSSLQRQSVITKRLEQPHYVLYSKGAPETIAALCRQETIPSDFEQILARYTERGFRVLALADRELPLNFVRVQKLNREEAERELRMLGLLIMGNMLKPQSKPVLRTLLRANIRCVMVTGDNMLTALSVSRECGMIDHQDPVALLHVQEDRFEWRLEESSLAPIAVTDDNQDEDGQQDELQDGTPLNKKQQPVDLESGLAGPCSDGINSRRNLDLLSQSLGGLHLAMTGPSFAALRDYYPESLLHQVIARGTIFARMSPEQKQQLIELLQGLGYFVGMCGDGANDCGALKAAHAGMSLSETEASVASPFTSKQAHIGCVPTLIREGRASLVTAFGILKYMAAYSITQFLSVLILYTYHTNLTDMEFLYIDLFLISIFVVLFGRAHAYPQLAKRPPPSSLIGLVPLLSMLFQFILIVAFQFAGVWWLHQQPWYVAHTSDSDDLTCDDNYAVFAISVFQYISLAVIFSKGVPYRKAIYTNVSYLISLIVMSAVTVYVVVYPEPFLQTLFAMDISHIPIDFRFQMVILAGANLLLAALFEIFFVDYLVFRKFENTKLYRRLDSNRPAYEKLRSQTADLDWLRQANVFIPNNSSSNVPITTTTIDSCTQTNGDAITNDSYSVSNQSHNLMSRNNNGCVESLTEDNSVLSGHSSTAMLITELGSQQSSNHGSC